jgi:hypothetical protein
MAIGATIVDECWKRWCSFSSYYWCRNFKYSRALKFGIFFQES